MAGEDCELLSSGRQATSSPGCMGWEGFILTLGGGIATNLLKDNGSSTASAATESERKLPDKDSPCSELVFFWSTYFYETNICRSFR